MPPQRHRRNDVAARLRSRRLLDARLHVLVYSVTGRGIRVVSLRRANKREVKRYGRRRKVNPELIDEDNPEWTRDDFARAKPGAEVLPAAFVRKVRGRQKSPTKERITIRLSRDVLAPFRESGPGWQTKMDDALRQWLKQHTV